MIEEETDRHGIFRTSEGVLVNKDMPALNAYKKRKKFFNDLKEKDKKIDRLEEEMGEIKSLLHQLLEKQSGDK